MKPLMPRSVLGILVSSIASLVLATSAGATIIPLSAMLDGAQANAGAGTGSPGTGTATITFDTVTSVLTWNISWSGLSGVPTLARARGDQE